MQCPKCNQTFPSEILFKQHAIAAHGAPQSILSEQMPIVIAKPALAQEVKAVTPAVFDETESYTPVSSPNERPRSVPKEILEHGGAASPQIPFLREVPKEKLPIELKYAFVGNCARCGSVVKTTMVNVKGETFCLAICVSCEDVCATRKVKPL